VSCRFHSSKHKSAHRSTRSASIHQQGTVHLETSGPTKHPRSNQRHCRPSSSRARVKSHQIQCRRQSPNEGVVVGSSAAAGRAVGAAYRRRRAGRCAGLPVLRGGCRHTEGAVKANWNRGAGRCPPTTARPAPGPPRHRQVRHPLTRIGLIRDGQQKHSLSVRSSRRLHSVSGRDPR
jgi:hypothetical protein